MRRRLNASPGLNGVFTDDWLLCRRELGPGAKLVYAALARQSDPRGVTRAHLRELARELGVGEEAVAHCLVELEELGLMHLKRHAKVSAHYCCTFLRHPWMVGAEGDKKSAGGRPARRVPLSKFPFEVCQWFTAHLISKGRRFRDPRSFAGSLYWTGKADDEITRAVAERGGPQGGETGAATELDEDAHAARDGSKKAA